MPFPFEVEQIATIDYGLPVVLARYLTPGDVLPRSVEEWTLGGCRLVQYIEIEPGLRADGTPRVDLFAFALRSEDDLTRFAPGLRVLLEES